MRRAGVALERSDPLFEQSGLAVNVSRFPALRQQSVQQQTARLLATTSSASSGKTSSIGTATAEALLTVRALAGSGVVNQEPILRIEIVSEDHDPFVLYLAEITLESFSVLKEEQALRVNFEGFSLHVVQLLEKCAQGEFRLSLSPAPALTARTDGESNHPLQDDISAAAIASVYETTSFRELSHLSLRLERATEAQTRQYLWERLRQENRRVGLLQTSLKRTEQEVKAKSEEVKDVQAHVEAIKLQLNAERTEFQASIERRHVEALREARLEVSDEERERKERNSQRIIELEAKVKQLEEDLSKAREAKAEAEAEALRRSGASDALGPLRAEANELRTRCRDFESRAFEESARSARLQEHVNGLERELALKEDAAARANELLRAEREKITRLMEETDVAKQKVREAEQRLNHAESREKEIGAKHDATENELETLNQKVRTKNLVIKEQERVVKDYENEVRRLKASIQDAERELSIERTKNTELRTKIQELKQHLEESAKTLEANASVITYLNRELSAASGGQFYNPLYSSSSSLRSSSFKQAVDVRDPLTRTTISASTQTGATPSTSSSLGNNRRNIRG